MIALLAGCAGGGSAPTAPTTAPDSAAEPTAIPTAAPAETPTAAPTAAPAANPTAEAQPAEAGAQPAEAGAQPAQAAATQTAEGETHAQSPLEPTAAVNRIPAYTYHVVNTYPHDAGAYTQGLQYIDGQLYEGTGQKGASSLRREVLETGAIEQKIDLSPDYFGEGITVFGDHIWQLTWQENTAFQYDRDSFEVVNQVSYPTEGWGLTTDGKRLIMSDGTDVLYFRDPSTFAELGKLPVRYLGVPLTRLNELEWVDGEIWSNVYQTNYIVRIDPDTGEVVGVIDLTGILDGVPLTGPVDVLNGIAYDAATNRLFVTGKWWPALFEITLEQAGWAQ